MKINKDIRGDLLGDGLRRTDGVASGPVFSSKKVSDGLILTMYDRAGQERLDVVDQEQQRIINLISGNMSQFLNAWSKKRHDMVLMLTAGRSCQDVLIDLERIWIHESPLNYQRFCKLLRISTFSDILAIAKQYTDEQYYVNQQNNWCLSPMRQVIAHALVSMMLRYSFELGVLKLPLDERLQQLLDLLQTDAEADDFDDDQRQSLLLNGMVQEVRNLKNTLPTYQSSFFNRKDFVEACIEDKVAIILRVLARANKEVYRALIAARDHFLSYKGALRMPNTICGNIIDHYKAVARDQHASWEGMGLPSDSILKTSFDKNNIMQQLYLSFLVHFMRLFVGEDTGMSPSVSLALEKFQQFAQSQDVEFTTIF